MKRRHMLSIALVLMLAATEAPAATLTTGGIKPPPDGSLVCEFVNVSSKPIEVQVEILELFSTVPVLEASLTIAPGRVDGFVTTNDSARWCRFTFKGGKSHARASIFVMDAGGGATAALDAR